MTRTRSIASTCLFTILALAACGTDDGGSGATSAAGDGEVATACLVKASGEPSTCTETLNDGLGSADQRSQTIATMRNICKNAFGSAEYSFHVVPACPVTETLVGYCERTIPEQPLLRTSRAYNYADEDAATRLANDSVDCLRGGFKYVTADGDEVMPRTEPLEDVAGIAAGEAHVCARTNSGKVYCWGMNDQGQLGNGELLDAPVPFASEVPGLEAVVALSALGDHTCALHEDGSVSCWGENSTKVVDGKTKEPQPSPVKVEGISGAVSLATSQSESCVLSEAGRITCWGERYDTPTELVGLEGVKAISAASSVCVLFDDATAECGLRCTPDDPGVSACERQEPDFTDAALHAGSRRDSCVVTTDKTVVCGSGSSQEPVPNVSGALALSFGIELNCALLDDGAVVCWPNYIGSISSLVPKGVTRILSGAQAIAGSCALLDDGTVSCWGLNADVRGSYWPGQLTGAPPAVSEPSQVVR